MPAEGRKDAVALRANKCADDYLCAFARTHFGMSGTVEPDTAPLEKVTEDQLLQYKYTGEEESLPDGVDFIGASLSLKSLTTLSLYFESDEIVGTYAVERVANGNYQILRIRNIPADCLDQWLCLEFTAGSELYLFCQDAAAYGRG